jgi:outer membrane protein TolC
MKHFEHSWSPHRAITLGACLFGLSQVHAIFAASARDQVAPSFEKQWAPPNLSGYQDTLQRGTVKALQKGKELVDLRKEYTLPDLIDLAEQLNPATRTAWQNARQALALVGFEQKPFHCQLGLARNWRRPPRSSKKHATKPSGKSGRATLICAPRYAVKLLRQLC